MKRILSMVLALAMMLGLLAGLGITASAEENEGIAFGASVPEVGSEVSNQLTGIPDGFVLDDFIIEKYDYADNCFDDYVEATYADDSVYLLYISIEAEDGNCIPYEEEDILNNATVGGVPVGEWGHWDSNENGYTGIIFNTVFVLGNINVLDGLTIESLPAEEEGTSTAATEVDLPEGAPYKLDRVQWYTQDPWDTYDGATLEANTQYELDVYLLPQEGFWFSGDIEFATPMPVDSSHFREDEGFVRVSFVYDTNPTVDVVEITGIPGAEFGEEISVAGLTAPEGAEYTLDAAWKAWDNEYGWVEAAGSFGYGEYILEIIVTAPEGYTIDENVMITIDGENALESDDWEISNWSQDQIVLEKYVEVMPENGYVETIRITGAPSEIEADAAISAPTLTVTQGKVSITNAQWVDEDYAPVTGKFADGKVYYLAITIKAADGYGLRNGYYAEVERKDDGYDHPYQEVNEDGTATIYMRYSLMKQVDKIEVTYTEPAVGKAPAEPKVPEGVKYSISEYYWYEEYSDEEVTAFEDGKVYFLDVYIQLAEGYETANNVAFLVNGEETYEYGHDETTANLWLRVSFKKQIDRIDITMPEPELGGEANVEDITVPQDANYSIYDGNWNAYNTEFDGVFGKDKYELYLQLDANEGYEFAEEIEIYINGELYEEGYAFNGYMSAEVSYQVSFREKISKVEIPQLPVAKVGEEAVIPTLEAPEGANYTIMATWMEYQGSMFGEPFDGTFENKKAYYLTVYVVPNLGYEFSEDVAFTVGGKAFPGLKMVSEDSIICMKLNNLGLTEIKKVELTVEAPEIGKAPGKLVASEDVNYEIIEQDWSVGETDDAMEAEYMGEKDVFAEGKYYWIAGMLQAKEGCVFAEDVQITVNGQPIDVSFIEEIVGFSSSADIAFYAYGFDKLEAPAPETPPVEPPVAGNPATGDMQIVSAAAMVIVSMATMAVTVVGKKKFLG